MFLRSQKFTGGFVVLSASALVLALQACGGGGGGSGSAVAPTTSTPATATPTTAPPTNTPTPVPSVTPGPVTASWAGINGYNATSPPNFVPTFGSPQPSGFVGEDGPPIVYSAVGQTVHVTITQLNAQGNSPSSLNAGCNNTAGTLVISNAVNGSSGGSFDLTLTATTGGNKNCFIGVAGSLGFNFGNYLGGLEILQVQGP